MHDTVAIVLPRWMAWMVLGLCVLSVIQSGLRLYIDHLKSKLQ